MIQVVTSQDITIFYPSDMPRLREFVQASKLLWKEEHPSCRIVLQCFDVYDCMAL